MSLILYLHGFASGPQSFKAKKFEMAFKNTKFALYKFAMTPRPEDFQKMLVSRIIQRLKNFIEANDDVKGVIGSSMGGYLASVIANEYPEKINAVVLLAPAFSFPWFYEQYHDILAEWKEKGYIMVDHYTFLRKLPLHWQFVEDLKQYQDYHFDRLTQPILIFHGKNDETVPIETSRKFAASRKNVTLIELDDDHLLHKSMPFILKESVKFFEKNLS